MIKTLDYCKELDWLLNEITIQDETWSCYGDTQIKIKYGYEKIVAEFAKEAIADEWQNRDVILREIISLLEDIECHQELAIELDDEEYLAKVKFGKRGEVNGI